MKAVEDNKTETQPKSTGTARRSPKLIGYDAPAYTLDEFIRRSELVSDVLRHILVFPLPQKKAH
jgi:hypothetical protein